MKKAYLLLALLVCIFIKMANAQGSYVITQKNDTIKCYKVAFGFLKFNRITYKVKPDDKFKTAGTDSIKEFQLSSDSSIYVARKIPGEKKDMYLKWVERGRINLYLFDGNDRYWYANKNADSLQCLRIDYYRGAINSGNKARRKVFLDMISDQPKLLAEFKGNDAYDADAFQHFIESYNITAATGEK